MRRMHLSFSIGPGGGDGIKGALRHLRDAKRKFGLFTGLFEMSFENSKRPIIIGTSCTSTFDERFQRKTVSLRFMSGISLEFAPPRVPYRQNSRLQQNFARKFQQKFSTKMAPNQTGMFSAGAAKRPVQIMQNANFG